MYSLSVWRPHQDPLDCSLTIPRDLLADVWNFWMNAENLSSGLPLSKFKPEIILETDSSTQGWGSRLIRVSGSGPQTLMWGEWNKEEKSQHINVLEMWAVQKSLQQVWSQVGHKSVLIRSDNSSVVACINRQGGTKSGSLCRSAYKLLQECRKPLLVIRAEHIPGRLNMISDSPSRMRSITQTEWSLPQLCVNLLCDLWGTQGDQGLHK